MKQEELGQEYLFGVSLLESTEHGCESVCQQNRSVCLRWPSTIRMDSFSLPPVMKSMTQMVLSLLLTDLLQTSLGIFHSNTVPSL